MRRGHRELRDELSQLHEQMDRLMDGLFGPTTIMCKQRPPAAWRPTVDVVETPDEYSIMAELPGVTSDSLDVSLEDRFLVIRGVRKRDPVESDAVWRIMEINYGPFERILRLPEVVDGDEVKAELSNGFLKVTLKKVQHKQETRRVSVK